MRSQRRSSFERNQPGVHGIGLDSLVELRRSRSPLARWWTALPGLAKVACGLLGAGAVLFLAVVAVVSIGAELTP